MQKTTVQFPSVTYARKALATLEKAGVRARLSRRSERGCGYAAVLPDSALPEALELLRAAGIPFSV